jgi:CRP/FNR family transcriptional regulator, cyclic AMP receptor protein
MAERNAPPQLNAFLQDVFACSADVAEAIGARAVERRYLQSAVIVRQGDPMLEALLLWLGRARARAYTREGELVVLQDFMPGDLLGALTAPREPSGSEVVALEASAIAAFLTQDFALLAERFGCVGLALSRNLIAQLRAATLRMVERTTLTAAGRVYAELLRLADLGDGREIRPAPVLAGLAARVQTTRESASRAVSALERRGVVRRDAQVLVILSRERLEDLVV